jgi:hypothetical protein
LSNEVSQQNYPDYKTINVSMGHAIQIQRFQILILYFYLYPQFLFFLLIGIGNLQRGIRNLMYMLVLEILAFQESMYRLSNFHLVFIVIFKVLKDLPMMLCLLLLIL